MFNLEETNRVQSRYLEDRRAYEVSYHEDSRHLQNIILAINAAAIAASIGFAGDVLDLQQIQYIWILIVGIFFFLLSVIACIFSIYKSIELHRKYINIMDGEAATSVDNFNTRIRVKQAEFKITAYVIDKADFFSVSLCAIGLVLLFVFFGYNLFHVNDKKAKSSLPAEVQLPSVQKNQPDYNRIYGPVYP